jgi:FADH2 O2-dependent halogenase
LSQQLDEYGRITLAEADHTAHFIGSCYASFPNFENFTAYSMFYFAAASYSEMARRFDRAHLATRFLATDSSDFATALREFGSVLRRNHEDIDSSAFAQQIAGSINGLNIAGLCNPEKHNWYGVDLNDVITGAAKLGMTPEHVSEVLKTAEWAGTIAPHSL